MAAERALKVAVVGGGWAGLAAAVQAVRHGHQVQLFEMAPQLGGRARSVAQGTLVLDNGQHILIGAYTETLALMRAVGVAPEQVLHRMPLRLRDAQGRGLALPGGAALPSFVRGVLAQRDWRLAERLRLLAVAGGWALRGFDCPPATTVMELSRRLPAAVVRDLVEPLCVAALNTPAGEASGQVFLRVLRDALFAGPGSADLLLPSRRLDELLPAAAARWLAAHGASIACSQRVSAVEHDGTGWRVDGTAFDHVVLAASATEAARLAEPHAPVWAARAAALRYEPIVTVYVRSQGTVLPEPMLTLAADGAQRPAQFVFDLGRLGAEPGLLAFVISGARRWVERGADATRDATLAQASEALAPLLNAPLQAVRVVTEKRATFRCTPGLERPGAGIAAGFTAAGDYVAGPYPATLEGAVRAGLAAVPSRP